MSKQSLSSLMPVEVLHQFFAAMNRWERDGVRRMNAARKGNVSFDEVGKLAADELKEIFREFCLSEEPERSLQFQKPPEYDPETEKILSVEQNSPERATITTEQTTGFCKKCIYELTQTDSGWRIARRWFIDMEGKRVSVSI